MDEETTTTGTFKKVSGYTPLVYVTVLIAAFLIFVTYLRRKKINEQYEQKPFFPRNIPREMYFDLASQEDPKPTDKLLKAALIRRGAESVRRTIKLKEVAPFMKMLYQKGSLGDELWERFQIAQKLEELEIQEIVAETEKYKKGWVQLFVPLLQEVCFNEALRRRYAAIEDRKLDLLDLWGIQVDATGQLSTPNKTANQFNPQFNPGKAAVTAGTPKYNAAG